ncbi:MAG: translation initiation factor IF-2 N-terminal domain-containing protein, partial [Scrofimicrobium sp.]
MRVHELAKELGITSKELREYLDSRGEFVKSASSMVEAPIVRQVSEHYTAQTKPEVKDTKETKAPPKPAAKPAKVEQSEPVAEKSADKVAPGPRPGPKPAPKTKKVEAETVVPEVEE